jgi:UDP-N-acetylglucosamine--N-acetylmuramyl-(pentapeptide) pyrophosphoryl-undecaprenol N-acetylglucosamine transferase
MRNKKVIITSGGTGGHIIPAIVFGKKLDEEGISVLFLGDVKLANYIDSQNPLPYENISCGQSLKQFKSIIDIIFGFIKSLYVICKFKADVVVGFGCYATLPVLLAAVFLKKSIFLHEQNSHVGKINKFFLSRAKYIFTSFYEIYGINIKDTPKIEFTGNPVRSEIKKLYDVKYKYPSAGESFNILILGGSGGASFFAEKFINIFKYFPLDVKNKLRIVQQVKEEPEIEKARRFYKKQSIDCDIKMFFVDMAEKLREAQLVISRAGVGIASELAIAGKPTIFVPSPNVANNHQFFNADFYRKNGACILLEEKDFDEKNVADMLLKLIKDEKQLDNLSNNIRNFAYLDAEEKIYKFIIEDLN